MNLPLIRPFPVEALGPLMGGAVLQHHRNTGLSLELIAAMALGGMSGAVHGHTDVQRPNSKPSPSSLFVFVVADSSEGKDHGSKPFLTVLRDKQAELQQEAQDQAQRFKLDKRVWDRKVSLLVSKVASGSVETEAELQRLHANPPKAPRAPSFLFGDFTVTAAKQSLSHEWPFGTFVSTEGSELFGSRAGHSWAFWNDAWDGNPIYMDRADGQRSVATDPRLSLLLGVQPVLYDRFLTRWGEEARGSGFAARGLWSFPQTTVGRRLVSPGPHPSDKLEAFNSRQAALITEAIERTQHGDARKVLSFSTGAELRFVEMLNNFQRMAALGGRYASIAMHALKAADNAARIAVTLHVADDLTGLLSEETLGRAEQIVIWFLDQSMWASAATPENAQAFRDAQMVEGALVRAWNTGTPGLTLQQIGHWVPELKQKRKAAAVAYLLAAGRVWTEVRGRNSYVHLSRMVPALAP